MRISLRREDPGFTADFNHLTVFFNGQPQSRETGREVITADEDRGEVLYYAYRDGRPIAHPVKRLTILERVENGRVEIRLSEKGSADEGEAATGGSSVHHPIRRATEGEARDDAVHAALAETVADPGQDDPASSNRLGRRIDRASARTVDADHTGSHS